jgi:DNA-binding NarL/FixJ family response regulator
VIIDIHLPSANGIEILEAIKNTSSTPSVVKLTNYPYARYEKKYCDFGTDLFLDKSKNFEFIPTLIADIAITLQMEPSS